MIEQDSTRQTVRCLPIATGKYAVFRRRKGKAHFTVLHDSYEAASNEAARLLVSGLSQGKSGQTFFVVKMLAYFTFDQNGKPEYEELTAE